MSVYTCKWGIMATGGIAASFVKDLLDDPSKRGVSDVQHEVVAVASSSSADRAKEFVQSLGTPSSVATYGNYQDLVNDKNCEIIYVATPHGRHYEDVKLALHAGKHVLCEKAFTINEAQMAELAKIAKTKKLFLMEAVWTRFFPMVQQLQKMLFEDKVIGDIRHVSAENFLPFADDLPLSHRMLAPELGGGALLDLGIYALTWIFMIGYNDPNNKKQPPMVRSLMRKHPETGVDESTAMVLLFPASQVTCTASTSMRLQSQDDACVIRGSKGQVNVHWSPFRPQSFTVVKYDDVKFDEFVSGDAKNKATKEFTDGKLPGHGMFYEADECARCLRDGKLESDVMSLKESQVIMGVMDQVRKDNGFKYPEVNEAL